MSQTDIIKPLPSPSQLISKKYYQPVIKEEQKHHAYLLTRFLKGRSHITKVPGRMIKCILLNSCLFTTADKI